MPPCLGGAELRAKSVHAPDLDLADLTPWPVFLLTSQAALERPAAWKMRRTRAAARWEKFGGRSSAQAGKRFDSFGGSRPLAFGRLRDA